MIRHLALFTVIDEKQAEKDALIAEAAVRLAPLVGQVPGLRSIAVHTDELGEGNYDFTIIADLDDLDAVKVYATHPAHVEAASFIGTFRGQRAVVDYEI
ncbi:Dabb family protein [Microbacterium sp. JB110]|uniref:Dabb family protein n=1 Tax=Microbacterium sp. JB110 TaxID=2024477 RepID=UPI00097EBA8E|nr:Dabb family protein [Microbacterium sp. JB110]RCS57908.1 Dabb family protein [Microbacterium sp. JB110]SJM56312.1 Stress responsive alpha-beta barrel domain protein Dabb [Frigoribacterium sp. JB110]